MRYMKWYESADVAVSEAALHEAQFRMWVSVVILSLREYCALHRAGYLKDGKITEKCHLIGRQKANHSCHRVLGLDSVSEVHALLEFFHGEGLSIVARCAGMSQQTEKVIRRGLQQIESGEIPRIMSHEPDAIDRGIRLWRAPS